MTSIEPAPVLVSEGISYRVQLRATPGRSANGEKAPGLVMWSADLEATEDGPSLTASASTPTEALAALQWVITGHTESQS